MSIIGIKVIKSASAHYEERVFDFRDLEVVGAVPHGDEDKQCTQKWSITKSPEKEDAYLIQNTLTSNTPKTYLSVDTARKKAILSTTQRLWKIQPIDGSGHYLLQLYDSPSAWCSLQSGDVNHPVTIVNETQGDQEQWFLEDVGSPAPQDIVGLKYIESVASNGSFFEVLNEEYVFGDKKHAPHIGKCSEKWKITRSGRYYVLQDQWFSHNLGVKLGRVVTSEEDQEWDIKPLGNGHYTIRLANSTDDFCSFQGINKPITLTKHLGDHQEWIFTDVGPALIQGLKYIQSVGHEKQVVENSGEYRVEGWDKHEPHKPCFQKWNITKTDKGYVLLNDRSNMYLGINSDENEAVAVVNKDYWNILEVNHASPGSPPWFMIQNVRTKGFCNLEKGDDACPVNIIGSGEPTPNNQWILAPADSFSNTPCPTRGGRA